MKVREEVFEEIGNIAGFKESIEKERGVAIRQIRNKYGERLWDLRREMTLIFEREIEAINGVKLGSLVEHKGNKYYVTGCGYSFYYHPQFWDILKAMRERDGYYSVTLNNPRKSASKKGQKWYGSLPCTIVDVDARLLGVISFDEKDREFSLNHPFGVDARNEDRADKEYNFFDNLMTEDYALRLEKALGLNER